MKGKNKAFLICMFFLFISSSYLIPYVGFFGKMVDYENIWSCIRLGKMADGISNDTHNCLSYPPVWIQLGKIFSGREIFYKQMILIIFSLIMPLILFYITKEWITVWFYFTATNYYWALLTSSFFPQAFSILLIMSMYFVKDRYKIILLFLATITHSFGFSIGLIFLILLKLNDIIKENNILLNCSPFFGNDFNTNIINSDTVLIEGGGGIEGHLKIKSLGSLLTKRIPLPFLYFGIKGLLKKKEYALFGLTVFFFVSGLFYHERSFYFMSLPIICGLGFHWKKILNPFLKYGIIFLTLAYLFFHLEQLFALGVYCG